MSRSQSSSLSSSSSSSSSSRAMRLVLLASSLLLAPTTRQSAEGFAPQTKTSSSAAARYYPSCPIILPPSSSTSPNPPSTSLHLFGTNNARKKGGEEDDDDDDDDDRERSGANGTDGVEGDDGEAFTVDRAMSFFKVALPSFLAGGVVTLGFLFLPLLSDYYEAYNYHNVGSGGGAGGTSPPSSSSATGRAIGDNGNSGNNGNNNNNNVVVQQNVNQPVILFETILNDLNDAYVDDVDVQKLFETGVKAMTSSLDPYTEFESRVDARELEESVTGRYGGVGLVIRGGTNLKLMSFEEEEATTTGGGRADGADAVLMEGGAGAGEVDSPQPLLPGGGASPVAAKKAGGVPDKTPPAGGKVQKVDVDDDVDGDEMERRRARKKSMEDGIHVVSAFEGYAYDAGMRVGDKLLKIDDFDIKPTTAVDEVRNHLRGEPGTPVTITFAREGVGGGGGDGNKSNEPQTITLQRSVVRIPDVKYFGFVGDPNDGIGYIDLSGFANDAGREVRYAIKALQHGASEIAAGDDATRDGVGMVATDPTKLKGLVLDLRSNPGGLLTSAVDVATLFVPNGSDIVSAKGRGFPETLYRSKTEPILNPNTRLAVLVNEQTASAAEIVAGAIQDLDVGVVVGKGRTFGKGLVQNVQDLPYQTALKYTVAKYYTPSGRCIQSTVYKTNGESVGAKYKSTKVADKDRAVFYTAHGRQVKDGGGVEVDVKVEPQKASPLEIILLNSGSYSDYAAEWSKKYELTDNFKVDDATYKDFQRFVEKRQKDGDMKLEILYDSQLKELQKKLKASEFGSSSRELEKLRSDIIKDVKKDFSTYKSEIIEDLEQNILARYLPDSMLIERGLRSDVQVAETAKMLKDGREFDKALARDNSLETTKVSGQSYKTSSTKKPSSNLQSRSFP